MVRCSSGHTVFSVNSHGTLFLWSYCIVCGQFWYVAHPEITIMADWA